MGANTRGSGIDIIGDVHWEVHLCQFYQTKEDLMDKLVPYFKAGLEHNEFCLWITSQPPYVEEAKEALKNSVPDIDVYLEKGQIEIIPYTHLPYKEGISDPEKLLNGWIVKLNESLANGYDGLRLTVNIPWMEKESWNDFVNLEDKLDNVIENCQIIALCAYFLNRVSASRILDIVVNNRLSLIKREGIWEQIENPMSKEIEKSVTCAVQDVEVESRESYDHLEELVKERTMQLEKAYKRLKESEMDLSEAQKMAHIGSWKWDILTGELYWSDEFYLIFGLDPQEFRPTYNSFLN